MSKLLYRQDNKFAKIVIPFGSYIFGTLSFYASILSINIRVEEGQWNGNILIVFLFLVLSLFFSLVPVLEFVSHWNAPKEDGSDVGEWSKYILGYILAIVFGLLAPMILYYQLGVPSDLGLL